MTDTLPSTSSRRRRLFLIVALAGVINLAGGVLLDLYFSVEAAASLAELRLFEHSEIIILSLLPSLLAPLLVLVYTRPLRRACLEDCDEKTWAGIRRRALRLPLLSALASLCGWLLLALIVGAWVYDAARPGSAPTGPGGGLAEEMFQAGSSFRQSWLALVSAAKNAGLVALLAGMVAAVMFFVAESVWQKALPGYFPGGRLSAAGDRFIIPVRLRLIAIFVLVGAAPLILLGVLSYQRAASLFTMPAENALGGLLFFNLFIVLAGLALAILLAVYVARSVSEPLDRQRRAMARVKAGDLSVRLPVRASDELGLVAEGFNDMAEALAEKEAAIAALTAGLEAKVAERTAALTAVLAEKERTQNQLVHAEKMASLGQLVAGVAHEINNPVGYIYANADHLETGIGRARDAAGRGDAAGLDEALARMEKVIASTREGARRAKEIVAGLRTFSYRDAALRKPLDLRAPIDTALMLLSHELKRGITVEKNLAATAPVLGNPGELSQVFTNILMNSIQALGDNGRIAISTRDEGDEVIAEIRDYGPGIRPEHLSRIFEPFFTTKDVGSGTGLGLSIVYGIVKAHGGEINVASEPGQGTTFTVRLPASRV